MRDGMKRESAQLEKMMMDKSLDDDVSTSESSLLKKKQCIHSLTYMILFSLILITFNNRTWKGK